MMDKKQTYENILLLDCTLRDGGQGLEAAYRGISSSTAFSPEIIREVITHLKKSRLEIIELGCIEKSVEDHTRFSNYQNLQEVSKLLPKERKENQMFVALYIGPDTPLEEIPLWNPELCDGVRVILRYSELKKSLDFCEGLAEKGYKVFVQPMLTARYTDEELELLIKRVNKMRAFALYIVDSYGYMRTEDIVRIYNIYNDRLDPDIRIGFHAHNNLSLAYANTIDFLNYAKTRKIIIDCCVLGMGQGAGNLQSELIVPYLNREYGKHYDYEQILDICDCLEGLTDTPQWGYSTAWVIPALYNTAYKYAMIMRMKMHFSYREINYVLSHMKGECKHRYTKENLGSILKELKLESRKI